MKAAQISAAPYSQTVYFLYGTPEELAKWTKRRHPTASPVDFGNARQGVFFEFAPSNGGATTQYIALVKRARPRGALEEWLAHECLHAAVAVLEAKGIPIKTETDEALTYYFQHLFSQCLRLTYDR